MTVMAVILGIILVYAIKPVRPGTKNNEIDKVGESLMDLARNLWPNNLIQATLQESQAVLTYPSD